MPSLVEPPPTPPPAATAPVRLPPAEFDRTLRLAEQGLRAVGFCLHLGLYAGLAVLAATTDFGPHVFAGVLLGDGAAFLVLAPWLARRSTLLTRLDLGLYCVVAAVAWHRFDLPSMPEHRAILVLAAFAGFVGRLGVTILQRSEED